MDVINPHRFSTAAPAVDFDGFGNASRSFDGNSDYIDMGDVLDSVFAGTGKQFTIAAWVKTTAFDNGIFLGKYVTTGNQRQMFFRVTDTGELACLLYGSGGTTPIWGRRTDTSTLTTGAWHHVAITYDQTATGDYLRMWIDGTEDASLVDYFSSGGFTSIYDSTAPLQVSGVINGTSSQWGGNLADVRIYDTDLSSTDIAAIYGGENITTNLVGHWLKDTPSLLDHSGTNDGTNVGSAFAYDNPSPAVEFGKASRSFDGVNDYVNLGDSDDFSFGNGATDSPFSICAWVKMTDATLFRFFVKSANNNNTEWLLSNGGDDKLTWAIYDASMSVYRGLRSQISLAQYENQWIHIAATYDGRGGSNANDGMSCYLTTVGGSTTKLARNIFTAGTYVAMHNTTEPLKIGLFNNVYSDGSMADMRLYSKELSSAEVQSIANGTHLETNLVGHWLTNTDDVKDYAGVNDGTNFGSTYSFDNPLGDGEFGSASRLFNGTSNYITVPDGAWLPTGAQTWACWVKADTITGNHFLMSHYTGTSLQRSIVMHIQSNGSVKVNISPDGNTPTLVSVLTAANSITTGKWYHVAFEYLPSTHIKIFINGSQAAIETTNIPSSAHDSTDVFTMGASSAGSAFLNGNLADCRIYDTNLSAQDIFDISRGYDYRTNLIGHWLTNKDDVDDYAGSNNGTNVGSTYSQDAPL